MYSEIFLKNLHEAFADSPTIIEKVESHDCMAGRWLDDNSATTISCYEVMKATSLEALKEVSRIKILRRKVYGDYMSGKCYANDEDRKRGAGCPRLYGQNTGDYAVLEAFSCNGVCGFIPDCPKYKSGECWKRFDDLGLKIK